MASSREGLGLAGLSLMSLLAMRLESEHASEILGQVIACLREMQAEALPTFHMVVLQPQRRFGNPDLHPRVTTAAMQV